MDSAVSSSEVEPPAHLLKGQTPCCVWNPSVHCVCEIGGFARQPSSLETASQAVREPVSRKGKGTERPLTRCSGLPVCTRILASTHPLHTTQHSAHTQRQTEKRMTVRKSEIANATHCHKIHRKSSNAQGSIFTTVAECELQASHGVRRGLLPGTSLVDTCTILPHT